MPSRPAPAERYLARAVASDAADIDAVDVDIEGRLRLGTRWYDFRSVLHVEALRAFEWRARVHRGPVRFSGHDRYADGHGEMLWKLYGLVPVMRGDGEDVTHSARGRAALEQVFLPSALARPEVRWSETDDGWARASWTLDGEEVAPELQVDEAGAVRAVRMARWSDVDGEPAHFVTFGAEIGGDVRHEGLVVPRTVRAGWFFGEPRQEEGRFFEGTVTGLRVVARRA